MFDVDVELVRVVLSPCRHLRVWSDLTAPRRRFDYARRGCEIMGNGRDQSYVQLLKFDLSSSAMKTCGENQLTNPPKRAAGKPIAKPDFDDYQPPRAWVVLNTSSPVYNVTCNIAVTSLFKP